MEFHIKLQWVLLGAGAILLYALYDKSQSSAVSMTNPINAQSGAFPGAGPGVMMRGSKAQ